MQFAVDFHIHTALSPCGDEDMTPNNIVNMALLKGLDIIAITDHNHCGNLEAVMEAGRRNGLTVIPGMEVQTKEEVHILCYFKKLEQALAFGDRVFAALPDIPNKESVFGQQLILNHEDEMIGKVEKLLLSSTSLTVSEVFSQVRALGGVCIPAHVDRSSFSIISNLGFIPKELNVKTVELSKKAQPEKVFDKYPFLRQYGYIVSSDAHYLWDISEKEQFIEMDYLSLTGLLEKLGGALT